MPSLLLVAIAMLATGAIGGAVISLLFWLIFGSFGCHALTVATFLDYFSVWFWLAAYIGLGIVLIDKNRTH